MNSAITDSRSELRTRTTSAGRHRIRVALPANRAEWLSATSLMLDYFDWLAPRAGIESVAKAQPRAGLELEDLAAVYRQPSHHFLLATQGGLAVGIVGLKPLESPSATRQAHAAGVVELVRFYCRPAARGSGVGTLLLAEAVNAARQLGFAHIVLDTVPAIMPAAVRLYESHGFVATDEDHELPVAGGLRFRLAL